MESIKQCNSLATVKETGKAPIIAVCIRNYVKESNLKTVNCPYFIVWLSVLREILGNMCIAIDCLPSCVVTNFKINLIVLIKTFFLQEQKFNTKI